MPQRKYRTVSEYLEALSARQRKHIQPLRDVVSRLVPEALEVISYNMPGFKLDGKILVWYAGYAAHTGFYPMPSAIKKFEKELEAYKTSKGAIQFPLEKPVPKGLVEKIVKFRVREEDEKKS